MVRQGGRAGHGRLGSRASAAAARLLHGQAGVRARLARRSPTKRCSCSRGSSKKTGGAGAFRVPQGAEAPLPGVPDLALPRRPRRQRHGAPNCSASRRAEAPLAGLQAGDVLDRGRRGARRPRRARRGPRRCDHRHRHDASGVGATCGDRRAADHEHRRGGGDVHQPARPRAALPAGQVGPGFSAAELVGARPTSSRALGEPADYMLAERRLRRARRVAPGIRRHVLRHARLKGALVTSATRRRRAA